MIILKLFSWRSDPAGLDDVPGVFVDDVPGVILDAVPGAVSGAEYSVTALHRTTIVRRSTILHHQNE